MANHLAIATVTATLRQVLTAAFTADKLGGASTTMVGPDAPPASLPSVGANVFLYQTAPNGAWRNEDLPTRTSSGAPASRPRTAVDLHYLLTFYGDEAKFEPQSALGSAVRALHARPVLTPPQIEDAMTAFGVLAQSDLAADVERVKLTPLPLTLEELSKLWSVFFQTRYRLSAAYRASVVLIDATDPGGSAPPVLRRNLYAETLREPVVDQVLASTGDTDPITAGVTVRIRGHGLRATGAGVQVDGVDATAVNVVGDTEITALPPPGLRVGVHGLRVLHPRTMGGMPPAAVVHAGGAASDVAPFALAPQIHKTAGAYDVSTLSPSTKVVGPITYRSADVRVDLRPVIGRRQRVTLLLNQLTPGDAHAYTFTAEPRPADGTTITVRAVDVIPGNYLLRVEVDGVASRLDFDPLAGAYAGPTVPL